MSVTGVAKGCTIGQQPKEPAQFDMMRERIFKEFSLLEGAVEHLGVKINPAMKPEIPEHESDGKESYPQSELEMFVDAIEGRINRMRTTVNDMINRLTL